MRENISPVREQHEFPMKVLSLSLVRENHAPVRLTSKAAKKRHGEINEQEKRKKDKTKLGGF